jgi:hypothetical protein
VQGLFSKAGLVNADGGSASVRVCRQFPAGIVVEGTLEEVLNDLAELLLDTAPSCSCGK